MKQVQKLLIIFLLLLECVTHAVTIVYNLRVAGTVRRQALTEKFRRKHIAALTVFGQFRQRYSGTKETSRGGLGTFALLPRPWYFKVDAALGKVTQCGIDGTYFTRTQLDDILFSGGYIASLNDRSRLALTGLFGVPTHKDFGLQSIQFGTGHVGIGAQIDGSHVYSANLKHAIVVATRFIHFFPRNASVQVLDTCQTFNVHLGNTVDLFISHQSSWNQQSVELGYNPIFAFGAFATPKIQSIEDNAHAIRNTFFANYRYNFLLKQHMAALFTGISAGFDRKTTDLGMRKGMTIWAGFGVNF